MGGACKTVVTARTRYGCAMFMECCQLLYVNMFPLRLYGAAYKSYITPTTLHGCETWCPDRMRYGKFVKDREIYGESNLWITAQR